MRRYVPVLLGIVFLCGCGGGPRNGYGVIEGLVLADSARAPVSFATVRIEGNNAGMPLSDEPTYSHLGRFAIGALRPGTYAISAYLSGYSRESAIVNVVPGDTAKVVLWLQCVSQCGHEAVRPNRPLHPTAPHGGQK